MSRVLDRQRLAKIAGRFGSDSDGERAAAALKFDAELRASGLTLGDVLGGSVPSLRPWQAVAAAVVARCSGLTVKERLFLRDMQRAERKPSDKQLAWLERLEARP